MRLVVIAALAAVAILLSGCDPRNPLDRVPELPEAVFDATQALSKDLGVSTDVIQLVSLTREDWPNACLGLPQEEETCETVATPGWRISFSVYGEQHVYRSDLGGNVVRPEPR